MPLGAAQSKPVAIVGIGALAGGLDALGQFPPHLPADSGLTFVVVQHLDPSKESALAPLLQRAALVPVTQIEDHTPVERNHVYVAPPGFEVSILHGVLHLLKLVASRGPRLPIDFFLRSLALDQQAKAAGVILWGIGSDGTMGARAERKGRRGAGAVAANGTLRRHAPQRH